MFVKTGSCVSTEDQDIKFLLAYLDIKILL